MRPTHLQGVWLCRMGLDLDQVPETIAPLKCPQRRPRCVPFPARRRGRWGVFCVCFCVEGWTQKLLHSLSLTQFVCLCGPRLFRIYLIKVFSPSHRNVSKCWILSSISYTRKKHRNIHKHMLQTPMCVYKSICAPWFQYYLEISHSKQQLSP